MAATLTYLQEWGWTTHCLYQWTRYETAFMTEAHINLLDDWLTIEATLLQELQQQRTSRFAGKKNCQSLVSGLDWEVAKKASKKLSALQGKHVKTSITSKESGSNTAHCAKCQPHPSTSFGCARGTATRAMRPYPYHGQSGCKIHWKTLVELWLDTKRTTRTPEPNPGHYKATAVGKPWNHFHSKPGPCFRDCSPWPSLCSLQ